MEELEKKIVVENVEEQEEDTTSYKYKKARFIKNCIQFVIGLILLFFAYQYLNQHPAEKASMVSWIKIIGQKIQVIFMNLWNKQWAIYDEKYSMERSFAEIVTLAKESPCASWSDLKDATNKYEQLKWLNIDQFKTQRSEFFNFASDYYAKLKTNCTKN